MNPRVSIVLPVRDAEATLELCLRSIARQSEPSFECLVVDDGSRDASGTIAATYAARDPRFRRIRTEPRGIVHALGIGIEATRAPFVARMDADDWMHRERLASQLEALLHEDGLAAVGAHVRLFPRRELSEGQRNYEGWLNSLTTPTEIREDSFVECPIAHPTLLARREAFERHPYRDADWPEDYDLLLRWLAAGYSLGNVARRLLGWRDHPERLSRRSATYALERFTACKASHLSDGFLRDARRYVLWGYGSTGRALRRALLEHGHEPSHIVELHPGRLGQRIHGAPVVAPDALSAMIGDPTLRVIASVAGAGPRLEIRNELRGLGLEEGEGFVCAA